LKPYWGKPAVRNFREGGGDVLMVWWPFAPKSERADTLEVTDLHSGAPPLYSTVSSLLDRYKTTGKFAQAAKTFNYSNAKDTKM
jgi:hypothetical protein